MAKESVLTSSEKESITIRHFIFHILIAGNETPTTLSEVELTDEQREFFCARLAHAAEGTQFLFTDVNASTPQRCARILDDPDSAFIDESIGLAQDFLNHHRKNMSDGVFIVALVDIQRGGEAIPLISLIKIDHTRVLEYKTEETAAGLIAKLQEVFNTFVEDKKALQKVALIDHGTNYAWDVLAKERYQTTDYFTKFLSVREREDASHWTRVAVNAVTKWAFSNEADLSDDVSAFKHRAISYMETHASFDTAGFVEMVLNEVDPGRREMLEETLKTGLANEGVAGQQFSPKPGSLPKNTKLNKRVTLEGVTVEWEGDAGAAGITIESTGAGKKRIVIDTSGFAQRN